MCGEQLPLQQLAQLVQGSPPRVRGTDKLGDLVPAPDGITPACAGNRVNHKDGNKKNKDHPRVCGEQAFLRGFLPGRIGSPPRVRGTAMSSLSK